MFNPSDIKKDFPLFQTYPELVFADNASTTQKPNKVIDAVTEYYTTGNANVHRAVYDLGVESDSIYHKTREKLCSFFNKENAIYTSGTTDGINKIARAIENRMIGYYNVVVSEMEHHSNLVPWQELCKRAGTELRVARILENGSLDLDHFHELVDENTKIVSLVHISNTLGTINDLQKIADHLKKFKCLFIVDAAQSCLLYQEEIQKIDADAFIFSSHKMLGPTGLGVILAKNSFLEQLTTFNYGGGMVTDVEMQSSEYRTDLSRFEAGTPPIAQVAGLSAALDYISDLDLERGKEHMNKLAAVLRSGLKKLGVKYIGNPTKSSGIVSAVFGEIHPHDVATYLNSKNIAVRAGHHCTQLIMKKYGIHSSVRFSFSIYNTNDDVARILEAVVSMQKYFK